MIELTHIGPELLTQMVNRSAAVRTFLAEECPALASGDAAVTAHADVQLLHSGECSFGDAHHLDVALVAAGSNVCVGLEAKLGRDRLEKAEFDKRFLKECGLSHSDFRISGSMTSILEGKLPLGCDRDGVELMIEDGAYGLSEHWVLVVRQATREAWRRTGQPELSNRCALVSFEDVVKAYGGRESFNALVAELLAADYYARWVE